MSGKTTNNTNNTAPRLGRGRRKPRTLKQHFLRRLLVIVPAFLLMFVIVKSGWLDVSYDKIRFNELSWFDNTALVEHLRLVVTHDGLTDLPRNCLVFSLLNGDVSNNVVDMDVLGRHGHDCPGDKPSADKLFSLKVDRTGHTIQTDAGSPGNFHPIQP
ncbi:hypothetical protein D5366_01260 [Neokomagataea tanensis]|uniref:Uncharacterized protein n=2 Tax=Neokomagataea TaxID=1223423 RepID=A0A4Y6V711_9PROT|nr:MULTISPECIES: hypothetical protein [Neokomagataea]QDH24115.1 hypothetical protein D5366_01260 [Neokomagataea tanensis]